MVTMSMLTRRLINDVFVKGMQALGTFSYVVACLYAYVESKWTKKDRLEKLGIKR